MDQTDRAKAAEGWHSKGYDRGKGFTLEACCESGAFEAEQNARQDADFCNGDCYDLNKLPSADDLEHWHGVDDLFLTSEAAWEAYDSGIGDAITGSGLPETCKECK